MLVPLNPNSRIKKCIILLLLALFPLSFLAKAQDIYTFKTPEQQTEFESTLKDLRCLVCQGQDLHESQTPLANTLRNQIHQWVLEGKSEKEILEILTNRYGEAISFAPKLDLHTYVLWFAPFLLLSILIYCFIRIFAKHKQ